MKKIIVSVATIVMGVYSVLSQGTVNFNNVPSAFGNDGVDRYVTYNGVRLTGTNYVAALYFGPSSTISAVLLFSHSITLR